MKEITLFNCKQEDESVDEPKELVEVVLHRQRAVRKVGAQRLVLGVREETLAEGSESLLDTAPKMLAGTRAFSATGGAPCFKSALGD